MTSFARGAPPFCTGVAVACFVLIWMFYYCGFRLVLFAVLASGAVLSVCGFFCR